MSELKCDLSEMRDEVILALDFNRPSVQIPFIE